MQGLVKRLLFGGVAGKALGVLRELVAAWCFGTGLIANAYRLAQAAFLLPLHGFVSDVINGAFTPHYARLRVDDPRRAHNLFIATQRLLAGAGLGAAVGLMFGGEYLVALMAPGFSPEAKRLTTQFVVILSLALPAYVVVGLYGATELVHGQGRLVAARASVQSCGLLVGTLAAWLFDSPLLIAVGFVAAYIALFIWSISVNRSLGLRMRGDLGSFTAWIEALVPIAKVFAVLLWVPISLQISQVIERRVASALDTNAVAALDYARFITETLLILIAMPFGVAGQAAMPTMAEHKFRETAERSISLLVIVGLPLSTFIWAQAEPIVTLLFKRGAFNTESVTVTANILGANALGIAFLLVAYAGQKFLNARGRNFVVLRSTVMGVATSVLCNLSLAKILGVSVLGLAAAASGFVVMVSALVALDLVTTVWRRTWTLWMTAAVHIAAITCWRIASAVDWWMEFGVGVLIWLISLTVIPAQRSMVMLAFGKLKRRGG